ncbi:MAG: S4 domain-containing protein [Gemmatimonadota bacterium]|nr:S4 domain-containing protein [Gemmatimonadota bacterium]
MEKATPAAVRLDKWLWAARFFKTRSLAAQAIDAGKVRVGGERVKKSRMVSAGEELSVRGGPYERVVVVRALSEARGAAPVAATLYEETPASREARERIAAMNKAMGDALIKGKPTKQQRRQIDRFRGR